MFYTNSIRKRVQCYEEGDTVTMAMDKNNTNNIINDDIIQNVTVNTY